MCYLLMLLELLSVTRYIFAGIQDEKALEKDRFNPMFRKCGKMPDEDFFFYCAVRAMGQFGSGRAFLQNVSLKYNWRLPRTRFFEALQSKIRMAVVSETAGEAFRIFEKQATMAGINFLKLFPELDSLFACPFFLYQTIGMALIFAAIIISARKGDKTTPEDVIG